MLENHVVTPVGSNDDKQVDVRAIAATSRKLEEMVRDNEFREDLYYRLNVVTIHLPPLRERPEDIPLLVAHFLKQFSDGARQAGSGDRSALHAVPAIVRLAGQRAATAKHDRKHGGARSAAVA